MAESDGETSATHLLAARESEPGGDLASSLPSFPPSCPHRKHLAALPPAPARALHKI